MISPLGATVDVDHGSYPAESKIDPLLESQFGAGRLYAAISSRPGQCGRADGYILEGKELEVRLICSHSGSYVAP